MRRHDSLGELCLHALVPAVSLRMSPGRLGVCLRFMWPLPDSATRSAEGSMSQTACSLQH